MPRAFVEDKIALWTEADQPAVPKQAGSQAFSSQTQAQMLYDARCSSCGKDTKVVFPPDGKRPVYCKSCRNKLKKAQEQASPQTQKVPAPPVAAAPVVSAKEISLKEALEKGPTLFHSAQKKQGAGDAKRREINKEALQKALGKALGESSKTKKGQLHPGETVYF